MPSWMWSMTKSSPPRWRRPPGRGPGRAAAPRAPLRARRRRAVAAGRPGRGAEAREPGQHAAWWRRIAFARPSPRRAAWRPHGCP
eukprot:2958969-Heterocapsa_arctica.AAC.1